MVADPEGETLVHLHTGQTSGEYFSGCGLVWKSKTKPEELSAWSGCLTCPVCTARLFLVHRVVTSWEDVLLLIDLDNPEVAQPFHFGGMRYRFRWVIGKPLIYVYDWPSSTSASQACHIPYGTELTYENAQQAAREFIKRRMSMFDKEFVLDSYKPGTTLARKAHAPVKKAIPSGPHCHKCLKIDEGDLMPDPADITKELCMPCLIKSSQ